jgi:hypothetical protein
MREARPGRCARQDMDNARGKAGQVREARKGRARQGSLKQGRARQCYARLS